MAGGVLIGLGGPVAWAHAWRSDLAVVPKDGADWAVVAGMFLLLGALVALHVRQRRHYGRLGRAAFWTTVAGLPSILVYLLGVPMIAIGLTALGAATYRANVLARGGGLLFAASVPVGVGAWAALELASGKGQYATLVFLSLHCPAWIWLGYSLWRGETSPSRAVGPT